MTMANSSLGKKKNSPAAKNWSSFSLSDVSQTEEYDPKIFPTEATTSSSRFLRVLRLLIR